MKRSSQTTKSLKAFIRQHEKELKGKIPTVSGIDCPACGSRAYLRPRPYYYYSARKVLFQGTCWYYHCAACNEKFTTGETDSFTIASMKAAPFYIQIRFIRIFAVVFIIANIPLNKAPAPLKDAIAVMGMYYGLYCMMYYWKIRQHKKRTKE